MNAAPFDDGVPWIVQLAGMWDGEELVARGQRVERQAS